MGRRFFSVDWTLVKNRHVARIFWKFVPWTNLTQIFIVPELFWDDFLVKIRWSPKKKKKGLLQNLKAFSGQNRKFKRFIQPKSGDLKKKGLRRNPKAFSGQNRKFERVFRPNTVTFSSHKPALKSRWGDT